MKLVISILFLVASLPVLACRPGIMNAQGECVCPSGYYRMLQACMRSSFDYRGSDSITGSRGFNFNRYRFQPSVDFRVIPPPPTTPTPAPVTPAPLTPAPLAVTAERDPAADEIPAGPASPETETPDEAETPAPAAAASQESLADTFASYDPATCAWTQDLPRKLHSAPGCTRSSTNKICVGYVVCNAKVGGGKFVRTATCSADNCGNSEAVACVTERSFYSQAPEENVGKYMSDRVKQVIGQ